jgi:hypothetical protein
VVEVADVSDLAGEASEDEDILEDIDEGGRVDTED